MEDLRSQISSMKQYQVATALPTPEEGKGMVREPRAQGHQVKAGGHKEGIVTVRDAASLKEAEKEEYLAGLLPSSCLLISCQCHLLTETSQRGDDMGAQECSPQGHCL